jgi:mono/diheme cytochrome c family protein
MKKSRAAALALVCLSGASGADESAIVLKDGPGKVQVNANCVTCHSLDYILQNSPFLDKKGWTSSVDKMVNVMGAPILPQDIEVIVSYLAENYGKK